MNLDGADIIGDIVTATDRGLPVVMYRRPRCPECGSTQHKARRTKKLEDGSLFRYTTCKACETNFGILAE